jgi:hypothetical protein
MQPYMYDMHLFSQMGKNLKWMVWKRMFFRRDRNPCHLQFVREKETETACELPHTFLVFMLWVVVLDKLSQLLSELCSTVGVKAFSNTTGWGWGWECTTLKEQNMLLPAKSSFSANFCVQYTSPKLMQHKPIFNFVCFILSLGSIFGGLHNWSAILCDKYYTHAGPL